MVENLVKKCKVYTKKKIQPEYKTSFQLEKKKKLLKHIFMIFSIDYYLNSIMYETFNNNRLLVQRIILCKYKFKLYCIFKIHQMNQILTKTDNKLTSYYF